MRFSKALAAQIAIGLPPGPTIVIGVAPIPPELVTYYLNAPLAPAAPETMVGVTIYYDGQTPQNYVYEGMVVDSSTPKQTSLVAGSMVAGSGVNEWSRGLLNPPGVLGGGRSEYALESNTLILHTAPNVNPAQTVAGSRIPGDTAHRWSLAANGTQGWGPGGSTLTDAYLARTDVGDLEIGSFLRLRGFGALTDDAFEVRQDPEANGRLFSRFDGQLGWSDGTNPRDTRLFRRAAGELSVDGDFSISTVGDGLLIAEGTNASMGIATLVAGTKTVNTFDAGANARIFLTTQVPGGTPGFVRVNSRVAGTSFTILSSSGTDTSQVAWLIVTPA